MNPTSPHKPCKIIIGTIHVLKTEYFMLTGNGQAVGKALDYDFCDKYYGRNNYEKGYLQQYTMKELWNSYTPLGNDQYETD